MKSFDLFNWQKVKIDSSTKVPRGNLKLRSNMPAALYVMSDGYEVLHSYGTSWDVNFADDATFYLRNGGKGLEAYYYLPADLAIREAKEVFTNIDRMPSESGTLLEIKKAIRKQLLESRATMDALRNERFALARDARNRKEEVKQSMETEPAETPAAETEAETPAAETKADKTA